VDLDSTPHYAKVKINSDCSELEAADSWQRLIPIPCHMKPSYYEMLVGISEGNMSLGSLNLDSHGKIILKRIWKEWIAMAQTAFTCLRTEISD
jgi:hypothetical protein